MFEKGCTAYTRGIAHVEVWFPGEEIKCYWCRFCRKDDMGRHWCRLTNEMIYDPQSGRGDECPIAIGEE